MLPAWRPSGPTIARSGFRMTRARAEAERAVRPSDAPARDHFQAGVGRDTYRLVGLGAWLEPEHLRAGVDGLARDGDRLRGGPEDIDDVDGSVDVAERRSHGLAEELSPARTHWNDPVPLRTHVARDLMRGAARLGRCADDGDRLCLAVDLSKIVERLHHALETSRRPSMRCSCASRNRRAARTARSTNTATVATKPDSRNANGCATSRSTRIASSKR